eukprot:IDg16126t1
MPQRRSTCGTRREARMMERCVVRMSPRGGGRQIKVVPTASGSILNSVMQTEQFACGVSSMRKSICADGYNTRVLSRARSQSKSAYFTELVICIAQVSQTAEPSDPM